MYALSEQQIDFILNDIKLRGVEMEDLQLNLLDHICCIIECEFKPEGDFENFYSKTIPKFFKKELKEIEEETKLLLTFKNYYAMKKTMNTVGIIASISIVLGAIFRFAHLTGANILMISGVLLVSFIFLPLMFTLKLRESSEKRERTILMMGCALSILLVIASAFKLMHWPAANILLGFSTLSLLFIFVPIYLFTGLRNPITKVNTLVNSILLIAGTGLLMSLSTNRSGGNIPQSLIDNIIGIHQRLNENIKLTRQHNAFIYNSFNDASVPADVKNYCVESSGIDNYLEDLKAKLIAFSENVTVDEAKTLSVDRIHSIGNTEVSMQYLAGEKTETLKMKFASLNGLLAKLKGAEKNKWSISATINENNFDHVQLGFVLQKLVELQHELVNTNAQVLNYYSASL